MNDNFSNFSYSGDAIDRVDKLEAEITRLRALVAEKDLALAIFVDWAKAWDEPGLLKCAQEAFDKE